MEIIKQAVKTARRRDGELVRAVGGIIDHVRERGDRALFEYSKRFDHIDGASLRISRADVENAYAETPAETVKSIRFSAKQVRFFAEEQLKCLKPLELAQTLVPGLALGHRLVPVERCGCYIPSGRYPLPSTAIMSVLVAKVAGVKQVAACSPPAPGSQGIHPAVLVAMDIAGADEIYLMGGAQAIAAYAYGTESVEKVDMIAGPGNKYVTEAKRQVIGDVGIDGLAGPSEVLIIADETANPTFLAIDLLSQAEHDPDAKSVLVCTDRNIIAQTEAELYRLLDTLNTRGVAKISWENNGELILAGNIDEAISLSNKMAPEHVEVQAKNERGVAEKLLHYGSLFVGHYAPVAFGDFVSGTNHTLPTMSTARFTGGLWVGTFIKTCPHQYVSREACGMMSNACMDFAGAEGLDAHRESVRLRLSDNEE